MATISPQRFLVSFGALVERVLTRHSSGNCWQNIAWPIGWDVLPAVVICEEDATAKDAPDAIVTIEAKATFMIVAFSMFVTPRSGVQSCMHVFTSNQK